MITYGIWNISLDFDGQAFLAEVVDPSYAQRAGFAKIYAIKGLPQKFEQSLIRSAQVCDVPHTWRVKECKSEDEVTEDLLRQGKEILDSDRIERSAHIITYVGDVDGSAESFEFLAAGAIRDKLTKEYLNEEFPVVSRAIVAPRYRGKGIGSLIVEHRFLAVLRFFSKRPKAIHFGTESKKILHSIKKVEDKEGITYVNIGNEVYAATDGAHTVADYLCFMPWYQKDLLLACDVLALSEKSVSLALEFKEKLSLFMTKGIERVRGAELEKLFSQIREVQADSKDLSVQAALLTIDEVFFIREKIGAIDPE